MKRAWIPPRIIAIAKAACVLSFLVASTAFVPQPLTSSTVFAQGRVGPSLDRSSSAPATYDYGPSAWAVPIWGTISLLLLSLLYDRTKNGSGTLRRLRNRQGLFSVFAGTNNHSTQQTPSAPASSIVEHPIEIVKSTADGGSNDKDRELQLSDAFGNDPLDALHAKDLGPLVSSGLKPLSPSALRQPSTAQLSNSPVKTSIWSRIGQAMAAFSKNPASDLKSAPDDKEEALEVSAPPTSDIVDDEFEKSVEIKGLPFVDNPLLIITTGWGGAKRRQFINFDEIMFGICSAKLRTFVDKNTGEASHEIYITLRSAPNGPDESITRVADPTALSYEFGRVRQSSEEETWLGVNDEELFMNKEDWIVDIPDEQFRSFQTTARFKVSCRSGEAYFLDVPKPFIDAQLHAIDEVRASASRSTP